MSVLSHKPGFGGVGEIAKAGSFAGQSAPPVSYLLYDPKGSGIICIPHLLAWPIQPCNIGDCNKAVHGHGQRVALYYAVL